MGDNIINTQWGDIYFERNGEEYLAFPAPDFVQCVLYDCVIDNTELIDAVNAYHLEEEPILWRETDEYGYNDTAAYEDFKTILESEFGIPVLEA